MIPNQWYALLDSTELPRNRAVGVTRLGERLVFFRTEEGRVACLRDRCVHRGAALSAGKVCQSFLECPFHGFRYDVDGRCRSIPANGKSAEVPKQFRVHTYSAKEAHGFIWVYWGETNPENDDVPFFDDLDGLSSSTFTSHWPVHYSRAIENQLDVMHLPFVHHNTIGRGDRTLVEGPLVKWLSDTHLRFYVFNQREEGQRPRAVEELSVEESGVSLDFIFPNVWQNNLGSKFRIVAAFAPVDEENTLIYLRLYQGILKAPLLRKIIEVPIMVFNRIVLNQDKRVVITQRPVATHLKMGEQLVPGDRPIIEFRRRREELIRRSAPAEV